MKLNVGDEVVCYDIDGYTKHHGILCDNNKVNGVTYPIDNIFRDYKWISPTGLKVFEEDSEKFYLQYLAKNRPKREEQTLPMSIGSAFDVECKSFLMKKLYGVEPVKGLFEEQVEIQNRVAAKAAGERCFKIYKECGALANLMLEIGSTPKFEYKLKKVVQYSEASLQLNGIPDCYFVSSGGISCVIDWKVNSYAGKKSPEKHYVRLLPENKSYKTDYIANLKGLRVTGGITLDMVNKSWCDQVTTYSWLLGTPVGGELVGGIEQLVGNDVRVASYRCAVSADYQVQLFNRYKKLTEWLDSWRDNGWFFLSLSKSGNDSKIKMIEELKNVNENWFLS